jgi:hypothetical protein
MHWSQYNKAMENWYLIRSHDWSCTRELGNGDTKEELFLTSCNCCSLVWITSRCADEDPPQPSQQTQVLANIVCIMLKQSNST